MPVGTIVPYVGAIADIPKKWALCDGTNGTPNLTGRFLQGWGWDDFYYRGAGEYVQEGLPNITGKFGFEVLSGGATGDPILEGAFWKLLVGYRKHIASSLYEDLSEDVYFDASRSSWLYGNSATVQPRAYVVYWIIKTR